ncbi:MAG: flagellar hook protein [Butyrivibrio sp.]|nr:flagellar hook protein [Butyrivibrio sp.]
MVVQHNITAMNSNRMLGITTSSQASATEKLSSGYRINRAADDAAGLSISEKMRRQMRGLDRASTNAEDGVSAVQTAEGALTEVHDMLQRMNELAVQAANGTNSSSDRISIQNEIDQLTTEIDRVAQTTKFNETYLLKGGTVETNRYMSGHDAGLEGVLTDTARIATFRITAKDISAGKQVTIGGKQYTIGMISQSDVQAKITSSLSTVKIDGKAYTIATDYAAYNGKTSVANAAGVYTAEDAQKLVGTVSTVVANGVTYKAIDDNLADGIDDTDSSIITSDKAIDLMMKALRQANLIGTDDAGAEKVKITDLSSNVTDSTTSFTKVFAGDDTTIISFKIDKGYATIKDILNFNLHVGADADMTNKINVDIKSMTAAGLGILNLNVADDSGIAATYAIDAIADAIQEVSDQRSALGAVQNRLEHTIKNVDNVVENTTAAESRIRDTDMAEMMVEYSKNNILAQAGQSMLAQANQSNQGVLSLLQG